MMVEGTRAVFEFPNDRPGERFYMERYDTLFIPGDMVFSYRNVGRDDVAWFSTVAPARSNKWPQTSTYFNERGEIVPINPKGS
jgi:hypothetical protein